MKKRYDYTGQMPRKKMNMPKITFEHQEVYKGVPVVIISKSLIIAGQLVEGYILMTSKVMPDKAPIHSSPLSKCRHLFPEYQKGVVYWSSNAHVHRERLHEQIADTRTLADELLKFQGEK